MLDQWNKKISRIIGANQAEWCKAYMWLDCWLRCMKYSHDDAPWDLEMQLTICHDFSVYISRTWDSTIINVTNLDSKTEFVADVLWNDPKRLLRSKPLGKYSGFSSLLQLVFSSLFPVLLELSAAKCCLLFMASSNLMEEHRMLTFCSSEHISE